MAVNIPGNADAYSNNPLTINVVGSDLALASILYVLEQKHPGFTAEARERLEATIEYLNQKTPGAAEMRREAFEVARSILE